MDKIIEWKKKKKNNKGIQMFHVKKVFSYEMSFSK